MQKCQCNPLHTFNYPVRMSQFFKIKDVSLLRQRKESKENVPC